MKPFRKHVAIAIDGGGMRGIIVTQALAVLEAALNQPAGSIFRLAAGTSTGSIISAGIAAGIPAVRMTQLYLAMGQAIFPYSLQKAAFPLSRCRYPAEPLTAALEAHFGDRRMSDFWQADPPIDVVITAYDLQQNSTLFIKPWKEAYAGWRVSKAVQASCTVPTYFPLVDGRYIDGGVGAYANPCYVAAYEARECLHWDLAETTLISLGTGREPYAYDPADAPRLWAWDWIGRTMNVFQQSAYDQQVHLVESNFAGLDFRRFQVNLREPIAMDDTSQMFRLLTYGSQLGHMILNDQFDPQQGLSPKQPD